MKVCMLVRNSFEYDARVTKEARALIAAGHEVTVVAVHVPDVTAEREARPDGIRVVRVSRMQLGLPTLGRLARRVAGAVAVASEPGRAKGGSIAGERSVRGDEAATAGVRPAAMHASARS